MVELRELLHFLLTYIFVKYYTKNRKHRVYRSVSKHQVAIVNRNRNWVKYQGEYALNNWYDQTSMNNKLGHDWSILVSKSSMPKDKSWKMFKFQNRKVRCKGCLLTLFPYNTHTNIGDLDHSYVISTISDSQNNFSGVFLYSISNDCFLSWRNSTTNYSRGLSSSCIKEVCTVRLGICQWYSVNNKNGIGFYQKLVKFIF